MLIRAIFRSWSEGVTIFLRHVYSDGMALMP